MRQTFILPAILCAAPALADTPRVAVDIAPVHSLVSQVMDGVGTPALIMQPGISPHDYSLRPSEASDLDQAELVIWMGEDLAPSLARSIEKLAGDARQIALLEVPQTLVLQTREEVVFDHDEHDEHDDHDDHKGHDEHDDHADEDGHDGHAEHAEHDEHDAHHHHDGADPHAWLSPENAMAWLGVISEELSSLDPENAQVYKENAARGVQKLEELQSNISQRLDAARDVPFMVFHDAYHYFEEAFDIHAAAALSLSDATRPGAARIAALRDLAEDRQISCILTEPQFDPKLANSVLGEEAVRGTLDPMGVGIALGPEHYGQMMMALADGIAGCAP